MALQSFFIGTLITYIPKLLLGLILLFAALKYFRPDILKKINYKHLLFAALGVNVLYALFQTIAQYLVWSGSGFTQLLLTLPISIPENINTVLKFTPFFSGSGGYFLFYAVSVFWLNILLSLAIAWLFWRFLVLLKKRNDRFFSEGETGLGFLTAFIAGWPGFVVFVPLCFAGVLLVALFRRLVFKESYTPLGPLFLASAALWLVFEPYFTGAFGLIVLKI